MDFELDETIGIDFGTSNSTVSKFQNGEVELVFDEYQHPFIPTYMSLVNNEFFCGKSALNYSCSRVGNTVYEIKRLIGRSYRDEVITKCVKQMPYDIVDDNNGGVQIEIKDGDSKRIYSIESLINIFVYYLKKLAEVSLGHPVKNCVLTVPSYFNFTQKQVIVDAVKATGLNILNVLTEPTAAVLAYYSPDEEDVRTKTMAVYDFGGGTFDVSIIQSAYNTYEVLATSSDIEVGGKDITAIVSDYIQEKLKENDKFSRYSFSKEGLALIRKQAEKMKIDLTENQSAVTWLELDGDDIEITLSRDEFEKRILFIVQRTIDVVIETVKYVNMKPSDIESIFLIGGSSFIPLVKRLLEETFPTSKICVKIDTRAAVATGALRYACIRKEGKSLDEKSSKTVILKNPGDVFSASSLLKKQTSEKTVTVDGKTLTLQPPMLPADYQACCASFDSAIGLIDKTIEKFPQLPDSVSIYDVLEKAGLSVSSTLNIGSITPYDIVNHALNQSTIAEFFKEAVENEYAFSNEPAIVTDVTPLSIGYVDSSGRYHELIKRNEKLPTNRTFKFSCKYSKNMVLSLTIADSCDPVSGEFNIIGCAQLKNVPPPENPQLSVTVRISIDVNNTMNVTIEEKQSKMKRSYYYEHGVSDNVDKVKDLQERNCGTFAALDEKTFRSIFNEKLKDSLQAVTNFVKNTGNAECKVTVMEMKEVMARQNDFTVDQLKEILGKIQTILQMYNIS